MHSMQPCLEALDRNFDIQPRKKWNNIQERTLFFDRQRCGVGFVDTGIVTIGIRFSGERCEVPGFGPSGDRVCRRAMPPDGYFMGSEYTREQINEALQAEDPLELLRLMIGSGWQRFPLAAEAPERRPDWGGLDGYCQRSWRKRNSFCGDYYMTPDDVPAYETNDIMLGINNIYLRIGFLFETIGYLPGSLAVAGSSLSQYISSVVRK